MLDATCIQTTCPEVSGLCLAPAGDGLLVGNQWKPVMLMRFSPEDGVLSRRELTFTTEIADLCYDPVRDVLWIADSESHILRLCTPPRRRPDGHLPHALRRQRRRHLRGPRPQLHLDWR